ncbi:MAG TPA: TonB-dependent receptor [Gemmatimonadales bacterium]|nr:TonB-dependent receptor [Gemmatimonadales bacterium]
MRLVPLVSVVLLAMASRSLEAQIARDTGRLRELVVTATRIEQPREQVASAVTVLWADALRERGVSTVADALRGVPSLNVVQTASLGGLTALFVRGAESDHVRVLVDGVPLNQPGGAVDLANLTLDNVERIEIVRGPASVLYGSDAVGGVVQIITRRGAGVRGSLPRFEVGMRAGAFRSVPDSAASAETRGVTTVDGSLTGASGPVSYSAAVSRTVAGGLYAYNSRYRNTTSSGQVALVQGGADGRLTWRRTVANYHYPTDGAGQLVDRNQFTVGDGSVLGFDAGYELSRRLEARLLLGWRDQNDSIENPEDNAGEGWWRFITESERRSADLRLNWRAGGSAVVTLGGVVEGQKGRTRFESDGPFGPFASATSFRRTNRAGYAQLVATRGRASAQLGARLEDNQAFGTFATYRIGGTWRLTDVVRLRLSHGIAFKEPQLAENYSTGFTRGNPDLRPERSRSVDAGVELRSRSGRASVEAGVFHQRFRDLIAYDPAAADPAPNYVNVVGAWARGAELRGDVELRPGLMLSGNATLLQTRVTAGAPDASDSTFVAGRPLIRRPGTAFSLMLERRFSLGTLSATVRHTGRRDDLDFSASGAPTFSPARRTQLPAYTLLDVAGSLEAGRAELLVRIENLTDRSYNEVTGFPARRRTVVLGVSVK